MKHTFPRNPVLIVDDDPAAVRGIETLLKSDGMANVMGCVDSRKVMGLLEETEIEVVLLDLTMSHLSGQELLEEIRGTFPEIPVIVVTGTNEVATAVECLQAGAFDYVVKGIDDDRLVNAVKRAVENRGLRRDYRELSRRFLSHRLIQPEAFAAILTRSEKMRSVFLMAEAVAPTGEPVLLTGETGVGKNLLAAAIHKVSGREGDLVEVNVSGLDEHHLSDTLFGHKKGAFTGADTDRKGLIEQARGGTILLDEIGDLTIPAQIKLLQLLDTGKYYPLGFDLSKSSDARIIAATNKDIVELMGESVFRRDLYYRLSTYEIPIPPVRERKDDLPLLFYHFLEEAAQKHGIATPEVPSRLLPLLASHSFPGNVRELRMIVLRAVAQHSSGTLSLEVFEELTGRRERASVSMTRELYASLDQLPTIARSTDLLIDEALGRAQGIIRIAAAMLGISRQALEQRLKRRARREHDEGQRDAS